MVDTAHVFGDPDPRTGAWLLMASPWPTLGLTLAYLAAVRLGRRAMRSREAFELRGPLAAYNLAMVLLNAWIVYELVVSFRDQKFNLLCNDVIRDPSNAASLRMARAIWWFYFSKCIEFMDTFFFVLRKRNRQITPLHLIHHSTMFPLWWIGTRVVPGGHASVPAMVNSSVHVLMYSYYFATGLGDSAGPLRALLSLKQHLTGMQLAQFVFLAVVTVVGLVEVHAGRCHLPLWMGYAHLAYLGLMIAMFSSFYIRTYRRNADAAASAKQAKDENGQRVKKVD